MLRCAFFICFLFLLPFAIAAQRIAVLTPVSDTLSRNFAAELESRLTHKFRIVDDSMSSNAFAAVRTDDPFNMNTTTARAAGSAIGCDFFILLRSHTLRRTALKRSEYYESYAAIYVVSSRTGKLAFWKLPRFEAAKPLDAETLLAATIDSLAAEIEAVISSTARNEVTESPLSTPEEIPDEKSAAAINFRAPIPYRRIKPEYTADASLYDIKATVDIMVDLDAQGSIVRTDIVRWAGFGLDASVEKAVRSMNWRPAERNGKTLAMRFLLRYNFKKIEKDLPAQ